MSDATRLLHAAAIIIPLGIIGIPFGYRFGKLHHGPLVDAFGAALSVVCVLTLFSGMVRDRPPLMLIAAIVGLPIGAANGYLLYRYMHASA